MMNDVGRQVTEIERWLGCFRERNGRAPTALHIGNIANAAYLNARMLNEAGIDCDVLCYAYYHIMGCPDWESAVFDPNGVDPDRPLWSPGPPIRPARAISSRSPATDAVLCSHATLASPYCSMPASSRSVAGRSGVVSSAPGSAFEA